MKSAIHAVESSIGFRRSIPAGNRSVLRYSRCTIGVNDGLYAASSIVVNFLILVGRIGPSSGTIARVGPRSREEGCIDVCEFA